MPSGGRVRVYIEGDADSLVRSTRSAQTALGRLGTQSKQSSTDLRRYEGSVKTAERETTSLGTSLKSAAKYAATAAAAYVGISQAKDAISATTDLAKATLTLNKNLGLSVKTSSEWAAVAKARGVDTRQLGQAFGTLSRQVEAAKRGTETAKDAFNALGISQKDLIRNSPGQTIRDVSDGMAELGSGTKRTQVSMQLFGRGWQTIVPILRDGSASLQEQLDLANKYGATFSGKSVKSVEDLIAAERELKIAQLGLQVQFTKDIAPALVAVLRKFAEWINVLRKSKDDIKRFIASAVDSFRQFWQKATLLRQIVGRVWDAMKAIFRAGAQVIKGIVETLAGIFTGDFGKAWRGVKDIFSGGIHAVVGLLKSAVGLIGDQVKAIAGVIANAFEAAWDKAKGIFETGANAVVDIVNAIIDVINVIPGVDIGHVGHVGGGGGGGGNTELHGQHRARGGKITAPMAIVGEEAPQHPEYVVATNPAYRMRNLQLWQQAGHDLGVPGFALGGVLDSAFGGAGPVSASAGDLIGKLPSPKLPKPFGGLGSYLIEKAKDFIRDHVVSAAEAAASAITGGMTSKGPQGIGTYMGIPMANWVITSLMYAAKKGVKPQPTSGYRSHAYNVSQGRNYYSEHEGTAYPHGAVDFGGYHDPVAYANKMAVVRATSDFAMPLLAPIGFVDDGHASGTGHRRGGILGRPSGHMLARGAGFGFANLSHFNTDQATTLAHLVGMPNPALMGAIAEAESSGNPAAVGDYGTSFGLWQIHTPSWPQFSASKLRDPIYNAKAAKVVLDQQGLTAWSTYNNGDYRRFLGGNVLSAPGGGHGGRGHSGSSGGGGRSGGRSGGSGGRGHGGRGHSGPQAVAGPEAGGLGSGISASAPYSVAELFTLNDIAISNASLTPDPADDLAAQTTRLDLLEQQRKDILKKLRHPGTRKRRKRLLEALASVTGDIASTSSTIADLSAPEETAPPDTTAADNAAALTEAIKQLKASIDAQNNLVQNVGSVDHFQALKAFGDLLSGELGGRLSAAQHTASFGAAVRS